MPDFRLSDIKAAFPRAVFDRGRDCAAAGKVLDTELSSNGALLTGRVAGTGRKPYSVYIHIAVSGGLVRFMGSCSCPVGKQCKHAAALLLARLGKKGKSPPAAAAAGADPLMAEWVGKLVGASRGSGPSRAAESGRLLYVLDLDETSAWVRPISVRVGKDGRIGGARPFDAASVVHGAGHIAGFLHQEDVRVLRDLHFAGPASADKGYAVPEATGGFLLRSLLETDRCVLGTVTGPAVRLGPDRPARLEWTMADDATQKPRVIADEAVSVLPVLPPWYLDRTTARVGPLATGFTDAVMTALLQAPPLTPGAAREARRQLLAERPDLADLVPREVATGPALVVRPLTCLRLLREPVRLATRRMDRNNTPLDVARLSFRYGEAAEIGSFDHGDEVSVLLDGAFRCYRRDRNAEDDAERTLAEAGLAPVRDVGHFDLADRQLGDWTAGRGHADGAGMLAFVLETVPRLRRAGWRVEVDSSFPIQVVEDIGEWYGEVSEASGIDWFGIELGVVIEGRKVAILPLLLDLIARYPDALSQRALADLGDDQTVPVPLPDNRLLPVPVPRLRAILTTLVDLYDTPTVDKRGRLEIPALRVADLVDLEDAFGQAMTWAGGERQRTLGRRLRGFGGIAPVPPPAGLTVTLRPYQSKGVDWLQFLREYGLGGILADDMGLGKTVQALAHILVEKESGRQTSPSLVVCPTSLVTTWRREAARFVPSLSVLALHGPKRRTLFKAIDRADLVITSYPLLPRDREFLVGRHFHCLILDEAQVIKNPTAQAGQTARRIDAHQRLCLTGTPMENHLGELWSLFDVVLPGFLGDERTFRRTFRVPIEKKGDEERGAALVRRVRPFLLRRSKEDVATELPPKTEILRTIELEGAQRDLYETIRLAMHAKVRDEIAAKGMSRSHITILDALLKLRQVCCDPRLVKTAAGTPRKILPSAKLSSLMEMLTELVDEGRRVLLFSQFTEMLGLIEGELTKVGLDYVKLTGQTVDRATPVDRFQAGTVPLFLISLKAGGTGLTLTAADTVIHYDPWWNPAVEAQATDRAHRIGQDKAVFVYKLVAAGTVEEKMLGLQDRKRALAASVYGKAADAGSDLTPEDLDVLFAPLADDG